MNVRSRGGQLGQAGLRGPPPSFVCHPSALFVSTSPPSLTSNPCLPALSLPPSVSATSRNRQGWLRDEARGDEGGGRGSPRRRTEEGGGSGVRSEPRSILSQLLPAGPGRTSRSEAHLLADIKPPYLRTILHPAPPRLVHPSSFLSSRRGLLAGQLSQQTLAICIHRNESSFSQERNFFVQF